MNKAISAIVATAALLFIACGSKADKSDVDFSMVPLKGENGEYQYIDMKQKGKITINPQFGEAHFFRDGLALVKTSGKDGNWGYIDKTGKFIVAPTYSMAQHFSEGVAWAQIEGKPPMLIDKKGKTLLQIDSLVTAKPFNDGSSAISVYSKGNIIHMLINKNGKTIATNSEDFFGLNEDIYSIQNNETKKWGFKNIKGETVINEQFDEVLQFTDGVAKVRVGDKWGAIDKKGNFIITPQYDVLSYDSDGLFIAQSGKKIGWINKKNEMVINPQYDIENFFPKEFDELNNPQGFLGNKLSPVKIGSKWAYIDKKGQIIINPQFDYAMPFSGDYAIVLSDNKVGLINQKGDFVVPPLYGYKSNREYMENAIKYMNAIFEWRYGYPADFGDGFSSYAELEEKKETYWKTEFEQARKETNLEIEPSAIRIKIDKNAVFLENEEVINTADLAMQNEMFIEVLYYALKNKSKPATQAQIFIDPDISYNVFYKVLANSGFSGYTDIYITTKINGKYYAEIINLPAPPSNDNDLNLLAVLSKDYIEISARGDSLSKISSKDSDDEITEKLTQIRKRFIDLPGASNIAILAHNDIDISKVMLLMQRARAIGFTKINLAIRLAN
jgi:biopolymer transport protein ExbD